MTVFKTAYGDLEMSIDTSTHMDYCDSFEMLVFGTELLQSVTVETRQVEQNGLYLNLNTSKMNPINI